MLGNTTDSLFPAYISRDEESQILAVVARVLDTGRSEAVLLYGLGGVGKTRLVRALAEAEAAGPVKWLKPIDLDDSEYWLLPNLLDNVAKQVDPEGEHFARYTEERARSPRTSEEHVTREAMVSHVEHLRRVFVECYAGYVNGTERPVAIVFDTVEAIRGLGLLITLTQDWMAALPRTLFVLSGRPPRDGVDGNDPIRNYLTDPQHPMPVTTVTLGRFPESTARRYLAGSRVAKGLTNEEQEKLVLLTQGHPLWLAHTVAYLNQQGLPEEATLELSVIRQELPFGGQLTVRGQQLHKEFRRRVLSVYRDADFWHEAVLRLAAVRQNVNEPIFQQLMADRPFPESLPGASSAWQQLTSMPWIRMRANGRYITLHDAVAEELSQTVIPVHDEDQQWRRGLWRRAAVVFRDQTEHEEHRFAEDSQRLDSRRLLAGGAHRPIPVRDETASEPVPFANETIRIGEEKGELDQLKASRFFYELLSDFELGCEYFLELFRQASRDQDLLFQDLLAVVMLRCLGVGDTTPVIDDAASGALEDFRYWLLDGRQALLRQISITLAEFLLTSGKAATAVTLLRGLPLDRADPHQVSSLKILLGNAYLRVPGEVGRGLRYLEEAQAAADDGALAAVERHRLAARAYKELGFYRRNRGQLGEAETEYEHARNAIEFVLAADPTVDDRLEMASIQSNWAYVKGLIGSHEDGLRLVESAIQVRENFSPGLAVGISLSIKGEVLRYKQKFKKAWAAYADAESIFDQAQDYAWLGTVYQEQAICLYQAYLDDETDLVAGDPLDEAWKLADRAIKFCRARSARGYPSALNRAARIISERDADQALSLLEEGIAAARAMSDGWFLLANLVEHAELSYRAWRSKEQGRYREEIDRYAPHMSAALSEYVFPDLRGRWEIVMGHLHVHDWATTGDDALLDVALRYYADGFLHMAERGHVGSSGAVVIPGVSKTFASLFRGLPANDQAEWIDHLRREWSGSQRPATMLLALLEELY